MTLQSGIYKKSDKKSQQFSCGPRLTRPISNCDRAMCHSWKWAELKFFGQSGVPFMGADETAGKVFYPGEKNNHIRKELNKGRVAVDKKMCWT